MGKWIRNGSRDFFQKSDLSKISGSFQLILQVNTSADRNYADFVSFQKQLAQEKKHLMHVDFAAAVCHLFRTNQAELARWQREYSYLLVDEFQDINAAQYEAVKLLCGGKRNLFVVGDDDQAIYGFRGSDPAIMRQFLKDFPEAKQIFLSVNYRSRCRNCGDGRKADRAKPGEISKADRGWTEHVGCGAGRVLCARSDAGGAPDAGRKKHSAHSNRHRIRHFRRCFRHELVALKHGSQRLGLRFSRSEAGGRDSRR